MSYKYQEPVLWLLIVASHHKSTDSQAAIVIALSPIVAIPLPSSWGDFQGVKTANAPLSSLHPPPPPLWRPILKNRTFKNNYIWGKLENDYAYPGKGSEKTLSYTYADPWHKDSLQPKKQKSVNENKQKTANPRGRVIILFIELSQY